MSCLCQDNLLLLEARRLTAEARAGWRDRDRTGTGTFAHKTERGRRGPDGLILPQFAPMEDGYYSQLWPSQSP